MSETTSDSAAVDAGGASRENGIAPLVSVIIPCRNYGHYLREALASVRAQTWRPLEVVIVDDGSTDDTAVVMAAFAPADIAVQRVHRPGGGLSAARNAGLDSATGELISFLDADDLLEPTAIADLAGAISREQADFAMGNWRNFTTDHGEFRFAGADAVAPRHFAGTTFANVISYRPVPSAFLMRRNPVRFDADVRLSELLDFILALGLADPKVAFVDRWVTSMRQHADPSRISNAHRHFEPVHRLDIVKRWRPCYRELPQLSAQMRAALDHLTLDLVAAKMRTGLEIDPVVADIDIANIRRQGLAPRSWALLEGLGVPLGLRVLPVYEKLRDALARPNTRPAEAFR